MKTFRVYYSTGVNWTCQAKNLRGAMWIATRNQSHADKNAYIEIHECFKCDMGFLRTGSLLARKIEGTWFTYKQHTNTTAGA